MVDLLDNFLNPLKLLLSCGKRFHEIIMTENGGGKERKINSRCLIDVFIGLFWLYMKKWIVWKQAP
jgi:hypothetical protein